MTKIPITPSIIKQVHALANLGDIPEGLKITNKTNSIIFYSAWISGVDYDKENVGDDDYDEEEDTNNDKNKEAKDYEYNDMDENKLADILKESIQYQVPL